MSCETTIKFSVCLNTTTWRVTDPPVYNFGTQRTSCLLRAPAAFNPEERAPGSHVVSILFPNNIMEKDEEDQLDRSCDK